MQLSEQEVPGAIELVKVLGATLDATVTASPGKYTDRQILCALQLVADHLKAAYQAGPQLPPTSPPPPRPRLAYVAPCLSENSHG